MKSLQAFVVAGMLVAVSISVISNWVDVQPGSVALSNYFAGWGLRLQPCVAVEAVASLMAGTLCAIVASFAPHKMAGSGRTR